MIFGPFGPEFLLKPHGSALVVVWKDSNLSTSTLESGLDAGSGLSPKDGSSCNAPLD